MGSLANQPTPPTGGVVITVTAVVAAALGVGLLLLPPSGTDVAAQVARTAFAAAHPTAAVDLRWYGGVLPAAYSVLAPYLQALVGVRVAGSLAAAVSAVLVAVLLVRWRVRRPLAASLFAAVALAADVVSGRTSFAIGLTFALATLVAVPRRSRSTWARPRRAVWVPCILLAAATTLTSPVAAVFLGLVCVVGALRRPALLAPAVGAGVPLLAIAVLFPEPGRMPFAWHVAWPVLLACLAVALLCRPAPVRLTALAYAAGVLVVYVVPGPVGSNVERLAVLFAGPVVVACARAPRVLLLPLVAVLAWWTLLVPSRDLRAVPAVATERAASERLVGVLQGLGPVTGRVEVVPFLDHGESAVVADAWPLARGWERQVEVLRDPVFYGGRLTPERYRAWLDAWSVQYVALGRHRHDWSTGGELALLAHPPAWLVPVHRDAEWTVWRVADSRPIVAAPGRLVAVDPARLVIDVPGAARVPVDIRWSRWLTVSGGACLQRAGDEVAVVTRGPGRVTISSSYTAPLHTRAC